MLDRRRLVCASPGYLARSEPIRRPADLARHPCLCFTNRADPFRWDFADREAGQCSVAVSGPLASDEPELLVQAAVAGLGVLNATDWYVGPELASGQLVEVLDAYPVLDGGAVYIVMPAAGGMPSKTRVFVDWVAHRLSRPPWASP